MVRISDLRERLTMKTADGTTIATVWARVQPQSNTEYRVTVRFRDDVTKEDWVTWRDTLFAIIDYPTPNETRTETVFTMQDQGTYRNDRG